MKKDYGKIAVTNGGIWNEQTPYEKLTTVSRGGQAYLSFEDNQGVDPEQDCDPITGIGAKWFRIATKGDPGTTDYNELINKPFIPTALSELIADALHRTVSDAEKTTWNNKQDSISDLGTIRSGAAAGATAYQKPQSGIPASDIANGVIPDVSQFITKSVNDLVNYYTKSETYTQSEVNALIGSMTGDLNLNYYGLLVSANRNGIKFTGSGNKQGVYVGNPNMRLFLEADAILDLIHKKGNAYYTILDEGNVKTVNGNSIYGSGDIDTKESFEVTYNVTPYADILAAYNAGKKIYCNYGGFQFFMTIAEPSSFYFQSGFHDYNLEMSSFYVSSTTGYSAINYQFLSQAISDLGTIRSGAAKGATAYQKPSGGIPESDLTSELQQTIDNVPSILQSISAISDLVPEQASSSNQLADKNFVNSSVATNTANYISNNGEPFTSLAQLEAYSGTLTNNDYAFVVGTDATGNTTYTRYKYNASQQQWSEEYVLNNSSFTAAQWASINSGIVGSDVTKLNALPTKPELDTLFAAKQDTLVSGTNIKTINGESILGAGNVNFAKYKDTLISSDAITCETTETVEGVSVYCSNADYYLQPNQKIVFADTVGNNTLYIINYDDLNNPFIISSGKDSISWNNFTNNDVRIQLASSSNVGQLLSASRYWRGTDDVFIAEYGVTTYQQVLDAYNAGKIVIAIKGDLILTLSRNYDQKFYFECGQGDTTFNVRVRTNNEWAYYAYTLEFVGNKATDFTTLNNTKYPTTKAVADYVNDIVGNINSILETI